MNPSDLEPAVVLERLREQSRMSDLSRGRLAYKVDMSAAAVSRRLRLQSSLHSAGARWARFEVVQPPEPPRQVDDDPWSARTRT
jgi:hypothetical protein